MGNSKIISENFTKTVAFLVVAAFSVFSAFWAISSAPIGNHEAYVGVTARQMLNTGNWTVPIYNGQPRLNKTPLNYWLVTIGAKINAGVNNFVLRLPSAALSVPSTMAIFYFVSQWLGFRIATLSSLIWSGNYCYMIFSHTGRPEMALAVFVTIAMLSFYSAIETQSRKNQICYMLVFWASFTLSMYAKGPAPLPLIFPALFFYFAIFRKWKLIPKTLPVIGTILFLLAFVPWPLAVWLKCPDAVEIWKKEYLDRATGEYAPGSKPFYYYFRVMFAYIPPFSAFIPLAFFAPFYKIWEEKRRPMTYLWLWFLAGIVVMSFCGGKRAHYILPMMPAMAILTGIILDDMLFVNKAYTKKFAAVFLSAHAFVFIAGAIAAAVWLLRENHFAKFLLLYAMAVILAFAVAMVIFFILNKKIQATACFFAGLCIVVIFSPFVENTKPQQKYSMRDFAYNIAAISDSRDIVAYCKIESSLIYYFGKDIKIESDPNRIYELYAAGSGIIAKDDKFEQCKKDSRFSLVVSNFENDTGLFMKIK
ncbi:MAG: glycosyltransferase family 39 protein [Phycisphaerae bacterium]|jgi:4-amino-4-deoxy-L-arabinose transferase-like glycosyltransferase